MAYLEFCGRPEHHLPHEYTPEKGYTWSTYICSGEIKDAGNHTQATLHLVLAAVMVAADDAGHGGYDNDHIEGVVQYRLQQAFQGLAETLREIIEPSAT